MFRYALLGGAGNTLGLVLLMCRSKSKHISSIGRLSIVPGICGINEPIMFGAPIVLNPIMFIPFILTPLVFMIIGYLLMVTGVVNIPALMLSVMTIPGPIAGFILGGGISLGIMIVIMCLLSCIIYYPFFKICDNQALEAEKKSNQEKTLEETVASSLAQIEEKKYDAELINAGVKKENIRHYGFAFEGKKVLILSLIHI